MKKRILLLILLFAFFLSYGQNKNIYDFFGGKSFGKSTVFYRLVFQIDKNNIISGYSFTDERGPKETKSVIQGKYNPKTNSIRFEETKKLITRNNNIKKKCYLNGKLSLKIAKNNNQINGVFFENTKSGNKCSNGKITLLSPDDLSQLKKNKNFPSKSKKEITNKITIPNFNTNKKTILKTNEEVSVYYNSNTLILEIWDEKKEDNDRITIKLNNKIILKNFSLKNKKKIIKIPLIKKENYITITANNTGNIGNNTARINLIDNKIVHEIVSQLELKKSVVIHIKKN